jgi:hypothetical protein
LPPPASAATNAVVVNSTSRKRLSDWCRIPPYLLPTVFSQLLVLKPNIHVE